MPMLYFGSKRLSMSHVLFKAGNHLATYILRIWMHCVVLSNGIKRLAEKVLPVLAPFLTNLQIFIAALSSDLQNK